MSNWQKTWESGSRDLRGESRGFFLKILKLWECSVSLKRAFDEIYVDWSTKVCSCWKFLNTSDLKQNEPKTSDNLLYKSLTQHFKARSKKPDLPISVTLNQFHQTKKILKPPSFFASTNPYYPPCIQYSTTKSKISNQCHFTSSSCTHSSICLFPFIINVNKDMFACVSHLMSFFLINLVPISLFILLSVSFESKNWKVILISFFVSS